MKQSINKPMFASSVEPIVVAIMPRGLFYVLWLLTAKQKKRMYQRQATFILLMGTKSTYRPTCACKAENVAMPTTQKWNMPYCLIFWDMGFN